jgi:hypothetical protein
LTTWEFCLAAGARRRIFIDVTPLRQSRDLRILLGGQLLSLWGAAIATAEAAEAASSAFSA